MKHCFFDGSAEHCLLGGNHCHLDTMFLGSRGEHIFSGVRVIKEKKAGERL